MDSPQKERNRSKGLLLEEVTRAREFGIASLEKLAACGKPLDARDPDDRTLLHHMAIVGDVDSVIWLLARNVEVSPLDRKGYTPLHFAAQEGWVQVAQALLTHGAPVDATDLNGNTPLSNAVYYYRTPNRQHADVILLLRQVGSNPLKANKHGQSPLGLARLIATSDVRRLFDDLP